jgi:hypothetical protein
MSNGRVDSHLRDENIEGISRREFLYYIWGASMALLGAEVVGAGVWYGLPHPRADESGIYKIDSKTIVWVDSDPIGVPIGKFWLSRAPKGLLALSMFCTRSFAPELFKWVSANNRFECPVCGSKFSADGTKISGEGPAPRDLDRFEIIVKSPSGDRRTPKDGLPVDIHDATQLLVNTNRKILGMLAKPYR